MVSQGFGNAIQRIAIHLNLRLYNPFKYELNMIFLYYRTPNKENMSETDVLVCKLEDTL